MSFDYKIFYLLNKSLACGFLDVLTNAVTYLGDSRFLLVFLFVMLVITKKRLRLAALLSLVSFAVAAGFVKLLKGIFARPRPVDVLLDVRLLAESGTGNSFPSGHTALAFAVALVFALRYPKFKYPLFALAALVGFSRVYTGAHFPSDVLAGAVLGSAIGLFVVSVARRLTRV